MTWKLNLSIHKKKSILKHTTLQRKAYILSTQYYNCAMEVCTARNPFIFCTVCDNMAHVLVWLVLKCKDSEETCITE